MRNSGKTGSTSKIHIDVEQTFSMDDVLYLFSHKRKVEKIYEFLRAFERYTKDNKRELSYTQFRLKHKADSHLLPIMKELDLAKGSEWLPERSPAKSDAVYLALKLRRYYQEKKK